jgi:hypothetical protein
VLICSERKVLLVGCWWLGWFVMREKYCWLVADKPSEQGEICQVDSEILQTMLKQPASLSKFLKAHLFWRLHIN